MNANEVLANRAAEILGGTRGDYALVHPNDHVNMGQSTNDVFPTATRVALLIGMRPLVDAARGLASALQEKADAFAHVLKVGRTHLQDAVPMTLGQEFGGYAACIEREPHSSATIDAYSTKACNAAPARSLTPFYRNPAHRISSTSMSTGH